MPIVIQPEVVSLYRKPASGTSVAPVVQPVTTGSASGGSATNPLTTGTTQPASTVSQQTAIDVATQRGRQDYFHTNGVLAARYGGQDDGKVGTRIWNSLGVLQVDQTYS